MGNRLFSPGKWALLVGAMLAPTLGRAQVFEPFTNFTTMTSNGATSPSSVAGNNYVTLLAPAAGGFTAQVGGPDGTTFVRHAGTESAVFEHQNQLTGFNTAQRTHQSVFFIRFNGTAGVDLRTQVGGVLLGDANFPGYMWRAGFNSTSAPCLGLFRFVDGTTSLSETVITGVTTGTWIPVIMQFEAPTTAGGNDGGFHVWVGTPASSASAPTFSRGTGVTGGSGTVGLGGAGFGFPANSQLIPGRLGFGAEYIAPTPGTPAVDYDRIALWNGPADLAGPDTALLQQAINWINAASDTTPPTATIARDMVSATNQDCVAWSVDFSESVNTLFTPSDVTPTGTLATGAQVLLGGDDPNYLVILLLDNANANGTIGFNIPAGVVTDLSGNPYAGGSGTAYTVNNSLSTHLNGDVNKNGVVDIVDVAVLSDFNLGIGTLP